MEEKIPESMKRIAIEDLRVDSFILPRERLAEFAIVAERILHTFNISAHADIHDGAEVYIYVDSGASEEDLGFAFRCAVQEYMDGLGYNIQERGDSLPS